MIQERTALAKPCLLKQVECWPQCSYAERNAQHLNQGLDISLLIEKGGYTVHKLGQASLGWFYAKEKVTFMPRRGRAAHRDVEDLRGRDARLKMYRLAPKPSQTSPTSASSHPQQPNEAEWMLHQLLPPKAASNVAEFGGQNRDLSGEIPGILKRPFRAI